MFNFHTHISQANAVINIDDFENLKLDSNYYYSVGNHPWFKSQPIDKLKSLILNNLQIIAIGECGIDKIKSEYDLDTQIENLKEQITLSEELGLPLILHIVKGFNEIIKLKKAHQPFQKWVIHGFNNYKQLDSLLNSGFYLSYGKSLLENKKLQNSFINSPLNKIFLETDDSDLDLKKLYTFAAELKKIETSQLVSEIRNNLKLITNG